MNKINKKIKKVVSPVKNFNSKRLIKKSSTIPCTKTKLKTFDSNNFKEIFFKELTCYDFKDNKLVFISNSILYCYLNEDNNFKEIFSKKIDETISKIFLHNDKFFLISKNNILIYNEKGLILTNKRKKNIIKILFKNEMIIVLSGQIIEIFEFLEDKLIIKNTITSHKNTIYRAEIILNDYLVTYDKKILCFNNIINYNKDNEYIFQISKFTVLDIAIHKDSIYILNLKNNIKLFKVIFKNNWVSNWIFKKNINILTNADKIISSKNFLLIINQKNIYLMNYINNNIIINLNYLQKVVFNIKMEKKLIFSYSLSKLKIVSSEISLGYNSIIQYDSKIDYELVINKKIEKLNNINNDVGIKIPKIKASIEILKQQLIENNNLSQDILDEKAMKLIKLKVSNLQNLRKKTEDFEKFHINKNKMLQENYNLDYIKKILDDHLNVFI